MVERKVRQYIIYKELKKKKTAKMQIHGICKNAEREREREREREIEEEVKNKDGVQSQV